MKTTTTRHFLRLIPQLFLLLALATVPAAWAQNLNWDPNLNNSGAGSGNWDVSTANWWNGSADVVWNQTSTTSGKYGAVFGGSDGAWSVTNDVGQVCVTNLNILNSGYAFYGNPLDINSGDNMNLAAGKTVTFYCNLPQDNNAKNYIIGANSAMNIVGNLLAQQPKLIGPVGSAYYLGGINTPSVFYVLGPVFLTNGSITTSASFFVGYQQAVGGPGGGTFGAGTLTISGGASASQSGGSLIVGRGAGQGTLTLLNGTVNVGVAGSTARLLALCNDSSGTESGIVNIYGGTLNMGVIGSSTLNGAIDLMPGGSTAGELAMVNQTGGVIYAWGGILLGASTGTYSGGSAFVTNSGGYLYLGSPGIALGAHFPPTNSVTLSGGVVGALANWSCSMPLTLATLNGNITFQCADNNTTAHNITLTGPLSGPGGLYESGAGTLTLSGANTYSGSTTISNGTLVLNAANTSLTNGPVTLDGSAGSPILSMQLTAGYGWSVPGLTYQNGTTTSDFQFGSVPPSTSVAPLQVAGNVSFASTPTVTVGGTALPTGTYPLIQYGGTLAGTAPTITTLPGYCSGYVTNLAATKTIALVVTSSSVTPALSWAVGNGVWDINTTANWKQFGNPVKYTDGSAVLFNDSASGTSPIAITLNTVVQPQSVTANNTAKSYVVSGSGSIAGATSLTILGGGTLTLGGSNAYTGGTVLTAGQLNINNGGDTNGLDSAIGSGPLTIAAGTAIDNTSGTNVVLRPNIPETWNGNFTYVGSSNSLNTGPGIVTMNSSVTLSVNGNNLTVGGPINDSGTGLKLIKGGAGALTLPAANSFSGGFELLNGQVNFGDPNAAGQGLFVIDGGSMDNVSGGLLTLSAASYQWSGSFTYVGSTTNILDLGTGAVLANAVPTTVTVLGGTLEFDQDIENGNMLVTKAGPGTLIIGGSADNNNQLGMMVTGGLVELARIAGLAIANTAGAARGLTVSNAVVLDEGNGNAQVGHGQNVPVTLESGGIFDLNGNSETFDSLTLNGGILRNGDTNASESTLSIVYAGGVVTLEGATNQIDVAQSSGLALDATITGSGGFVMNGPGTLTLSSNNIYTGETTISSGTIALAEGGAISASTNIYLAASDAALDLSQSTNYDASNNPLLTLQNGQSLSGFGVVTGLVATLNGATLAPGSSSAVGTLTVTGFSNDSNVLSGVAMMKLNKAGLTNDQLVVQQGSLVLGGTLALTNLAGTLAVGDTFKLFAAAGGISGAFASITPAYLTWNTNNLAVNGTISLVAIAPSSPPKLSSSLSGTTLTIQGTNGVPNHQFVVLSSTNVMSPLKNWVPVLTNSFDSSGSFSLSISTTNAPSRYFIISEQ